MYTLKVVMGLQIITGETKSCSMRVKRLLERFSIFGLGDRSSDLVFALVG